MYISALRYGSVYNYVSFDLDNTLYSYDTNSKEAVETVFSMLKREHDLSQSDLWASYVDFIQRIPGPLLFSDGRTSFEYRFERFNEILTTYGITDEELAKECVDIYSSTMLKDMKPFPEVLGVFERIQQKILVITDAPQDVQRTILSVLGIDGYVHRLYTPTTKGKIKEDGTLFLQALQDLDASPEDIIHFGDSYLRDIKGARSAGIKAVYYDAPKGWVSDVLKVHEGEDELEDVEMITNLEQIFKYI